MKTIPFFLLLILIGCTKEPIFTEDGTFTDTRDDHIYKSIKIGDQTWMSENLAYLPALSPSTDGSESSVFYYVYDYEGRSVAAAKLIANYDTYGVLYNWEAAKIACPTGWHLPSDAEWNTLTEYLGSSAGGLMKEAGTYHWASPNTGATNASGFTVLPGGLRYSWGGFGSISGGAFIWSSTSEDLSTAMGRLLSNTSFDVGRITDGRSNGYSVRCLKDQ